MRARDRKETLDLSTMWYEDLMYVAPEADLTGFGDFMEAVACVVFSQGDLERKAAVGALVVTASKLP